MTTRIIMNGFKYHVTVKFITMDMLLWLIECVGDPKDDWTRVNDIVVHFKSKSDAALFKLRWC